MARPVRGTRWVFCAAIGALGTLACGENEAAGPGPAAPGPDAADAPERNAADGADTPVRDATEAADAFAADADAPPDRARRGGGTRPRRRRARAPARSRALRLHGRRAAGARVSSTPVACLTDPACRRPQVAGHRGLRRPARGHRARGLPRRVPGLHRARCRLRGDRSAPDGGRCAGEHARHVGGPHHDRGRRGGGDDVRRGPRALAARRPLRGGLHLRTRPHAGRNPSALPRPRDGPGGRQQDRSRRPARPGHRRSGRPGVGDLRHEQPGETRRRLGARAAPSHHAPPRHGGAVDRGARSLCPARPRDHRDPGGSRRRAGPARRRAGARVFTDVFGADVVAGRLGQTERYLDYYDQGAAILQSDRPDLVLGALAAAGRR